MDREPADVFYSYAHEDEPFREELDRHLALLRRRGVVRTWHDRKIGAGAEWAAEIDENLDAAELVLLLVSADFLASDYCYEKEMTRALERHARGETQVLPVIIRDCDWHGAPFASLQGLPRDMKPVASWPVRDEAWTDVAKGIRRVVESSRPAVASTGTRQAEEPGAAARGARAAPTIEGLLARSMGAFADRMQTAWAARGSTERFDRRAALATAEELTAIREHKRILWVDDHPSNNRSETAALAALQIEVDAKRSTEEALEALTREPYHLVISDWHRRPQQDPAVPEGLRLLRAMRERGMRTPFVFYYGVVRGAEEQQRLQEASRAGAQAATYLPATLLEQVVRLLSAPVG